MGENYVARLRYAKCSFGTIPNKLNCQEDHGIIFGADEAPPLNASDFMPNVNIADFGTCSSPVHSGKPCPCKPATVLPWLNGNDSFIIEGAPILTEKSTLCCLLGGIITINPA